MQPELIADLTCQLGEGPLWHPREQRLYFVDILAQRLYRFDPTRGTAEVAHEGETIGGFTIQTDGSLLCFGAGGAVKTWRDGAFTSVVVDGLEDEQQSRFNDVAADPAGRVFCGTIASPNHPGSLYRLDVDGSIRRVLADIGVSNGIGFTPDRRQMYYTDSAQREIYLFDYAAETGEISNRREFIKVEYGEALPDGMTVDSEGCVWSAHWDGGCVVRYAADGTELLRVEFPAKKVSSVTFSGPDYDELFVTTAGGDRRATEGAGAGALFRLKAGVRGVPEFESRVRL
jgi:D-xylono/L-arabinono-1,4-lactonase